jgi:hypothetical protein
LTRLGIEEAKDQAKLSNLLGGAQVGTSGFLAAEKLKSVKDLIKNLGVAGKAASMISPPGIGAIYGAPSIGAGAGAGDISFSTGMLTGGVAKGYGGGTAGVSATGAGTTAAGQGGSLLTGASGATIGANLALLPLYAKSIGDYFNKAQKERRGKRESRALSNITPGLTDFGAYEPYLRGEVETAAGTTPSSAPEGATSETIGRLLAGGRFSGLAQEAGFGEELAPYQKMLGQIEAGKREGLQRFAPVARRMGLRPNVGRGDAHIAQEYWKRRREAQPTFDLDFGAGTATPVFPELEEDPYSYQNVGRP